MTPEVQKGAELGPQHIASPKAVDEAVIGADYEETKFQRRRYVAARCAGLIIGYLPENKIRILLTEAAIVLTRRSWRDDPAPALTFSAHEKPCGRVWPTHSHRRPQHR
jgi:hypothetical protein